MTREQEALVTALIDARTSTAVALELIDAFGFGEVMTKAMDEALRAAFDHIRMVAETHKNMGAY